MINECIFIVPEHLINQSCAVQTKATITIEPDGDLAFSLLRLYQKIQQSNELSYFSLCIPIPSDFNESVLLSIISFFFFPGYVKTNGMPLIILKSASGSAATHFGKKLEIQAKAQGFDHIETCFLIEEIGYRNLYPLTVTTPDNLKNIYMSAFRTPSDTEAKYIYIDADSEAELLAALQIIEETERDFRVNHPVLADFKSANKNLHNRLQENAAAFAAAQTEISNLHAHIEVLKSESGAAALQNFYNNEYEVLPAWYKKLGHVIKAVTGHRSWKSLFNDQVKKYKH